MAAHPSSRPDRTAARRRLPLALFLATLLVAPPAPGVVSASQLPGPAAPSLQEPSPPGTVTVDRGIQDPAVSPDGSRIAGSILGKIFLIPMEGGRAEPLTHGEGWHLAPAWSPDGRFVAYAHHLPGQTHLALLDLESGTSRFVFHTNLGISRIRFSPDGRDLYFVHDRNQYDAHVWRVPVRGGAGEALTETENWHQWSFALAPDGTRIFFESGRYGGADLYVMDLSDRSVERMTGSPAKEYQVAWTGDGRWVWLHQENGVDRIMVAPAGSAEGRAVWSSPYDEKTLDLTPDGRFAVVAGGRALTRVDLESGTSQAIPFIADLRVRDRRPGTLAVRNARVFTGRDDRYIEGATVLIREGRIVSVGPAREVGVPVDVPILDAAGQVLMAGLMDNHRHYWSPFAGDRLLADGVTAIRDPGVSLSESLNYRDANRLGLLPGPRIFTTGPLIDGPGGYHPRVDVALDRPEAAPGLVRAMAKQGVDAFKAYFLLAPEVTAAVVREARAIGLPVTGHLGVRTSWSEALDAGIHGFSHIRVWKDFLSPEVQPQGEDESLDRSRDPIARLQLDWRDIDPDSEEVRALLLRMSEQGAALDATLAVHQTPDGARSRYGPEEFEIVRDGYRRMQRFLVRAWEEGVPILAGTDNRRIFDELEAYADAGIPNAAILRSATLNGAEWLGRGDEFGTVEPGRRADLILVDGDPLADIMELRRITTVIQEGRIVVRQ